MDIDLHKKKAQELFKQGYNCSQAVFMAYASNYGITPEMAASLATSFGGGMGRLREVCGAVSGMFLVLGLEYPYINTNDRSTKNENYKIVQRTANEFKTKMGSLICADLLKIKRTPQSYISEERTNEYYAKRPCERCIMTAAEIVGKEIIKKNK